MDEPIDRSDLARRVAVLMEKAKSTDSEGEKAACIAKAQELRQKYDLKVYEIERQRVDPDNIKESRVKYDQKQHVSWKIDLAEIICRATETKLLVSKGAVYFYGFTDDVDTAVAMYTPMVLQIEDLAAKRTHEYVEGYKLIHGKSPRYTSGDTHPKVWRNSWVRGCLQSISSAVYRQSVAFEVENKNAKALVLVKKDAIKAWAKQTYGRMRTHSSDDSSNGFNVQGFRRGVEDGKTINARKQIPDD